MMRIKDTMPEDLRAAMKTELHRQLADATNLVWHLQHTLGEQSADNMAKSIAEIESQAYALREAAVVILGHVCRWSSLEEACR